MTEEELDKYFKEDKSDWYDLDEKGNKIWDKEKVGAFWEKIRIKTLKKDFNFEEYIFPNFEKITLKSKKITFIDSLLLSDNDYEDITLEESSHTCCFWKEDTLLIFDESVSFNNAIFQGNADFSNIFFKSNAKFSNCIFEDHSKFNSAYFMKKVDFSNSIFNNQSIFNKSIFRDVSTFETVSFNKSVSFFKAQFINDSKFINCSFKKSNFKETLFSRECDFSFSKFYETVLFNKSYFRNITRFNSTKFREKALFSKAKFYNTVDFDNFSIYQKNNGRKSKKESIFRNIIFHGKVDLSKILLPETFKFSQINLSNFIFHEEQSFSELKFIGCEFKGRKRLRLNNHYQTKNIIDLLKLNISESFYKNKESQYRGIKRNFEASRDWVLSGLAFRSEMEMKKRRLLVEALRGFSPLKFFEFLIFLFYGFFSGYTQSISKPFVYTILLIIFGVYYFNYSISLSLEDSIYRSISYTVPYLDLVEPLKDEKNYKIKNFGILQKVLGLVLITFFILSLRKRFKQ